MYFSAVWSWLSNPTVALLGLLSSLITIGQLAVALAAFVKRKVPREGKGRRRFYTGVALAGFAAVVGVSVLTWSAILVEAARLGDHGMAGVFDAMAASGTGLAAALVLLVDAREEHPFFSLAACVLVVTLASKLTLYLSARNVAWGLYPPVAAITAATGASQVLLIGYLMRRAKESAGRMPSNDHATVVEDVARPADLQ